MGLFDTRSTCVNQALDAADVALPQLAPDFSTMGTSMVYTVLGGIARSPDSLKDIDLME